MQEPEARKRKIVQIVHPPGVSCGPPMDCALPAVLDALAGNAAPVDARMVRPPAELDGAVRARAAGKAVYGQGWEDHVDTENFTLQWAAGDADPARAAAIGAALEAAWAALVIEERWPAPVSSEGYLLWVILDPSLAGSGYTTVYATDDFPAGYPVMYVNPVFEAETPEYGLSVAVHEFGHALQYRLRDWHGGSTDGWYWEATSEWVAERAAPDLDTYALSTYWYAAAPSRAYDSTADGHAYGMLLLNASLDEHLVGFAGIRDIWELAARRPEDDWAAILAESTGVGMDALVAEMSGAVAAEGLRESRLYYGPELAERHASAPEEATLALPGLYGTAYLRIEEGAAGFRVDGDVRVRYAVDGAWGEELPEAPFTVAITAVGTEGDVRYGTRLAPPAAETPPTRPEPRAACAAVGSGARWLALAGILAAALRRR